MHNIKTNFDKIIGVVKDIIGDEINEKGNYLRRGTVRWPNFAGLEIPINLQVYGTEVIKEETSQVRC